jgi:hypothetical protein
MRILCVETIPGAATSAADRLRAAGHEVVRCYEGADGAAGPCVGLDCGDCPLDRPGGVDAVLDARTAGHPRPTPDEAGVTCALRQHVPLVVEGPAWPDPFARWAAARIDLGDDPVRACEDAIAHHCADLGAMVSIAVCRALDRWEHPGVEITTDVRRDDRELRVTVHRPATDADADGSIATHALAALRTAGVTTPSISISCTT